MTGPLVVSLATSLDRYLWLPELRLGTTTRPTRVVEQAGGKALHTALAADRLGAPPTVVALAGGGVGASVRSLAEPLGWDIDWIDVGGPTRICTCLVDVARDVTTEVYEELPPVDPAMWGPIHAAVGTRLDRAPPALVLSGRVPPGLPGDAHAQLITAARTRNVPSFLDAAGPALAAGLSADPDLVKINTDEAAELLGCSLDDGSTALEAARHLATRHARAVIITRGAAGSVYADREGVRLTVGTAQIDHPHPVGSGDSFLGALVVALTVRRLPVRAALRIAAAGAAANSATVIAADITEAAVDRYSAVIPVLEHQLP